MSTHTRCFVPGCISSSRNYRGPKLSAFVCPEDSLIALDQWKNAIRVDWEKTQLPKRLEVCERHFHPDLIQRTGTCKDEHGNLVQFALGRISLSPGAVPTLFPEYLPSMRPTIVHPRPSPAERAAKRKRQTGTVNEHLFEGGTSSRDSGEPILTFEVLTEEVHEWFTLWRQTNTKVDWQLNTSAERVFFFELDLNLEEPRIARGITLLHDLIPTVFLYGEKQGRTSEVESWTALSISVVLNNVADM